MMDLYYVGHDICYPNYKLVEPTGRWKIVNNLYMYNALYIEVKFLLFFKTWINETDLIVANGFTEIINECNIHERSTS